MKSFESLLKKQYLLSILSAVLTAVLLVSMLACGYQVNAWFIQKDKIRNEATLSNFQTKVEYAFGNGTFTTLNKGAAITVTPDNVNTLKIRLSYQGVSSAYVRVKLYGSFYNQNTGTYLPQSDEDGFWGFVAQNKWQLHDGYYYYTEVLNNPYTEVTNSFRTFSTLTAHANLPADKSSYQDYEGKVYVIVDAVQPDRYEAFWNVTTANT